MSCRPRTEQSVVKELFGIVTENRLEQLTGQIQQVVSILVQKTNLSRCRSTRSALSQERGA